MRLINWWADWCVDRLWEHEKIGILVFIIPFVVAMCLCQVVLLVWFA